jgi:2-polyprenyl-3-methyl-5-hydroxy-6-metoxy-1,4-benzoquinol methylase
MKLNKNPLIKNLQSMGLIDHKNLSIFQNEIRDAKIKVLYDKKEKIYLLEKIVKQKNYGTGLEKITKKDKIINLAFQNQKIIDAKRRYIQFKKNIRNKKILDYGCGFGEFLKESKQVSNFVYGYENDILRVNKLKKDKKIKLVEDLSVYKKHFDYIFLFHVFEHLSNPVEILKNLKKTLRKNGKIILEVPNSNDLLISLPELKEFKKFTFWSGHLILYNEKFIKKFLNKIGFKFVKVHHYQRYNFQNHLGWFLFKKPGGHNYFKQYYENNFDNSYKEYLCRTKKSDTIIVEIKV